MKLSLEERKGGSFVQLQLSTGKIISGQVDGRGADGTVYDGDDSALLAALARVIDAARAYLEHPSEA